KHLGEVANSRNARSRKARAGVRGTPSVTSVRGLEQVVDIVMRKAATSFVNALNVDGAVTCRVARNLHVANETGVDYAYRRVPAGAAISGIGDKESATADIEIVPGNIKPPKKWRSRIVISPAGLTVIATIVMSTKMRPAIRARWRGRLVSPQPLTPQGAVEPHRNPGAGRLVIQSNRITESVFKRTLAAGLGEPGKGGAAIGRNRCAGYVDGISIATS